MLTGGHKSGVTALLTVPSEKLGGQDGLISGGADGHVAGEIAHVCVHARVCARMCLHVRVRVHVGARNLGRCVRAWSLLPSTGAAGISAPTSSAVPARNSPCSVAALWRGAAGGRASRSLTPAQFQGPRGLGAVADARGHCARLGKHASAVCRKHG